VQTVKVNINSIIIIMKKAVGVGAVGRRQWGWGAGVRESSS